MKGLAFITMVALIASCSFDKGEVVAPQIPCDTTLTFSSGIQPLVTLHCTDPGCHQPASAEGDLTTYSGVKIKADNGKLKQKVLTKEQCLPLLPSTPRIREK